MKRFTRLLEQYEPDRGRQAANSGKYAIADALKAQGIKCNVTPHDPTLTFDHNGYTFSVSVSETSASVEEEQESVSPEDQAIQDEINSLKMADGATNNDPTVERAKRDLSSKVGQAYGKISQTISRI